MLELSQDAGPENFISIYLRWEVRPYIKNSTGNGKKAVGEKALEKSWLDLLQPREGK